MDTQTPTSQSTPPVRAVLGQLLAGWQEQSDEPGVSEPRVPPEMIADLKTYLEGTIPPHQLTWTIYTPAEPGRYAVALSAESGAPIHTSLVVGDLSPPEPKEDLGDGRGPLQAVRPQAGSLIECLTITYQFPRTLGDRVFFAPLQHAPRWLRQEQGWRQWDMGWLLTYIVVYLLVLLPVRWLLQIP